MEAAGCTYDRPAMNRRYFWIAAALLAVLLLAFFLWPQTPGEIEESTQPGGETRQQSPG